MLARNQFWCPGPRLVTSVKAVFAWFKANPFLGLDQILLWYPGIDKCMNVVLGTGIDLRKDEFWQRNETW